MVKKLRIGGKEHEQYSVRRNSRECRQNVKPECLHEGWQTSGSQKVVRMAFNLYCNGTPSVYDYEDAEEQLSECKLYALLGGLD